MPTNTGTTVEGERSPLIRVAFTSPVVLILFPNLPTQYPSRKGYYYLVGHPNTSPFQGRVLLEGVLYAPGRRLEVPASFGVTGQLFSLFIYFNGSGETFTVTYT